MENFVPGLRESVLALTGTLRVVVFFVCVVGLMVQVHAARADMEGLTRPLGRAIVIVALVATLPTWFDFTEKLFLSTANVIEAGYTEHPMRTATRPGKASARSRKKSSYAGSPSPNTTR